LTTAPVFAYALKSQLKYLVKMVNKAYGRPYGIIFAKTITKND
jgi:hypothetical protein